MKKINHFYSIEFIKKHSNSRDKGFRGSAYDQKIMKPNNIKKEQNNFSNNFSLKGASNRKND